MQATMNQGYRLSPGQKHVWLAQQGGAIFRAGCDVLIDGNLEVSILEEAFRLVIRRHEILRTTFRHLPGMKIPVQLVGQGEVEFYLERRGLEGHGPLHASLELLADTQQLLHISLPSLCADAWSLKNLVREIAETYASRLENEQAENEVTQYVQFSEWQNELLEAEAEREGREFWRARDFSSTTELILPFEIQSSDANFTPISIQLPIDSELRQRIESFAQQQNVTVEVFLLACWHSLLWRLLRKPGLIVGQTFHGRSYEELHDALGLFARDLPVECQFEEHSSFNDLLQQCQKAVREAYQWQDYFTAGPGSPTFGFEYASALPILNAGGVQFRVLAEQVYTEPYKLKLTCRDDGAGYLLEMQYDDAKIERVEAERVVRRYVQLVRSALSGSEMEIRRLELIEESEREQVMEEWNGPRAEYGLGSCVHEVIERAAAQRPEAIAVMCENEALTYGELNERANQLAHYLRRWGIGPEARVGLLLERSVESVIALLAVLKAGAAYVPLDGAQPAVRLERMLTDANVQVLITNGETGVQLADGVRAIRLDEEASEIATESKENPVAGAHGENLAYVIYTSGSTGQAKGIGVEHRQLLNYIGAISERLLAGETEAPRSYATVSTFAADLGHTMIFPALCSGATLHVIKAELAANSEELGQYMSAHEVECLKIVPSHLQALLSGGGVAAGRVLPTRWLVLGGEAASAELVRRVQELRPECRVMNHYGPTETTVGVLAGEVSRTAASRGVALGRPLGNVRAYILDESGAGVLPVWVRGELYIGGASVARGYLQSAAETAARFVPDPYSAEPGGRMYRTGDRVRWRGDGQVEFLGRVDHQVKVRGYRVELGEVEAVLREHEEVAESVVVLREERLVGYYVRRRSARGEEREQQSRELRSWLSARLPEYMVPWVLVEVDRLPLTPNGKIDVKALPGPEDLVLHSERNYVEPRTEIEAVLAGIWTEVLRVKRVGVRDNFFELGGHSLLAMQILSRVRETFQVELPLRILFDATNVEALAQALPAYESKPGQIKNIARLLQKIKNMSSADIREELAARKNSKGMVS
jgi:amino acid adenylation domain-containing protein